MSSNKTVEGCGVLIVVAALAILVFYTLSWLVMLVFGAIAANTNWDCAISFHASAWIIVLSWLLSFGFVGANKIGS